MYSELVARYHEFVVLVVEARRFVLLREVGLLVPRTHNMALYEPATVCDVVSKAQQARIIIETSITSHVTRLYKIDKIVRRRNLNFRLRNISIHFWSMSQPELVKIAMETSAQNVFNEFPRAKRIIFIGDFKARILYFGTLRRSSPCRYRVETWNVTANAWETAGTNACF
jgi:hypothetical protein